mmetsp:Transcript_4466/g.17591  ORF Transcript_4466/g.17591 Transcript_4466/m.17591 type:complete len:327 (+) Transcript_4466:667-1647(+)|eukprot:scaffold180_cov311-Pinguiococcus_pyrenoidosus.AAC.53
MQPLEGCMVPDSPQRPGDGVLGRILLRRRSSVDPLPGIPIEQGRDHLRNVLLQLSNRFIIDLVNDPEGVLLIRCHEGILLHPAQVLLGGLAEEAGIGQTVASVALPSRQFRRLSRVGEAVKDDRDRAGQKAVKEASPSGGVARRLQGEGVLRMQLDHVRVHADGCLRNPGNGVEVVAGDAVLKAHGDQLLPAATVASKQESLSVAMAPCFPNDPKPLVDIGVRPGMEEAGIGHVDQAMLSEGPLDGKDVGLRPERIAVPKGRQLRSPFVVVIVSDRSGHHDEVILAAVPLPRLEALQVLLHRLHIAAGLLFPILFVPHAVHQHRER